MELKMGHLPTFYPTSILLMADPETSTCLDADIKWRLFGTGPEIIDAFRIGAIDPA